jgi:hypothetical protein
MENICNTIESLDNFFNAFGLSVRTLAAKSIESEVYLRGTCDTVANLCEISGTEIEKAFDRYKINERDLSGLDLTFAGNHFIIK